MIVLVLFLTLAPALKCLQSKEFWGCFASYHQVSVSTETLEATWFLGVAADHRLNTDTSKCFWVLSLGLSCIALKDGPQWSEQSLCGCAQSKKGVSFGA